MKGGNPFGRGIDMKPSSLSALCIFLFFCTFNGEICSVYNAFPSLKAKYLSVTQSKPCGIFRIRKAQNLGGSAFFKVWGEGCQEGGSFKKGNETPFRTMNPEFKITLKRQKSPVKSIEPVFCKGTVFHPISAALY